MQLEANGALFWEESNRAFASESNAIGSFYRLRSKTIAHFLSMRQIGQRHLDVGCGTGHLCNLMLCLGFDSFGVDPSSTQIEIARTASDKLGLDGQHRFSVGEVDTAFLGERFDVVTAVGVLPYVEDWRSFVSVLKSRSLPGGLIVVSVTKPFSLFTVIALWRHLLRPSTSREWRWVFRNLVATGLWSGGFRAKSQAFRTIPIEQIAKELGLVAIARIGFHNIASFDQAPLNRSRLANAFAGYFAWCNVLIFRVAGSDDEKA